MKEINRDVKRLKDILQSIDTIQQYLSGIDLDSFSINEMMQSACIRHLEIIGEASSKISEGLKSEYSTIPWRQIIALRNLVIHEYFRVDIGEIWITVTRDVPALKAQVITMLERIG